MDIDILQKQNGRYESIIQMNDVNNQVEYTDGFRFACARKETAKQTVSSTCSLFSNTLRICFDKYDTQKASSIDKTCKCMRVLYQARD